MMRSKQQKEFSMIRSVILAAVALSLSASLSACSPQQTAEATRTSTTSAAVHPVSGLPVVPLTVSSGEKTHRFQVEMAATPTDQARGLMFRTEMKPNEGMIFPRDQVGQASFWMKNTPLPLDIIFIGPDRKITNIAANTVPYSLQPVTSDGLASAVLELNAGRAAELGIEPGDRVQW